MNERIVKFNEYYDSKQKMMDINVPEGIVESIHNLNKFDEASITKNQREEKLFKKIFGDSYKKYKKQNVNNIDKLQDKPNDMSFDISNTVLKFNYAKLYKEAEKFIPDIEVVSYRRMNAVNVKFIKSIINKLLCMQSKHAIIEFLKGIDSEIFKIVVFDPVVAKFLDKIFKGDKELFRLVTDKLTESIPYSEKNFAIEFCKFFFKFLNIDVVEIDRNKLEAVIRTDKGEIISINILRLMIIIVKMFRSTFIKEIDENGSVKQGRRVTLNDLKNNDEIKQEFREVFFLKLNNAR